MTTKTTVLSAAILLTSLTALVAYKHLHAAPADVISYNPSRHYERIGSVTSSTPEHVAGKIAGARHAQVAWADRGLAARIAALEKVYAALVDGKEEIGSLTSQEMGMPASVRNRIDIDGGLAYLRGYLDHAHEWLAPETTFENEQEHHILSFEPRGVVGAITAWNYPFCNFIWSVMPNLVVGNAVVFKHSEECPLTGQLLEEIMRSAELPEGVCGFVHGTGADVGARLMEGDIDLMLFTGSTAVGKRLYELAGKRFIPAIVELGGSAPGVVGVDVDVDAAVDGIYNGRFVNSGQTCDGLKRLIVHVSRSQEVVEKLQQLLATKRVGDASDPATDIGPLVSARQLATLEAQVADAVKKGAHVVCGGKRPAGLQGAYYEPTILTNVTRDMRVWHEEVFGPVLPVVAFETLDEAVALANDTSYGLGGYVYTSDVATAQFLSQRMKTGNISVNGADYAIAEDPFGGYKQSGVGREHGKHGLRELCQAKLVAMKK